MLVQMPCQGARVNDVVMSSFRGVITRAEIGQPKVRDAAEGLEEVVGEKEERISSFRGAGRPRKRKRDRSRMEL